MSDDTGWVKAANRNDLAEGEVLGVLVAGKEIALYDLDGAVHATDDICTHAYAKLSDGWLDKGEIECPLHAGVEPAQLVQEARHRRLAALALLGHPHRARAIGIAFERRRGREGGDLGQQHRVRKPVRYMKERPDRPAHAVYQRDARIGERHPRLCRAEHHRLARAAVLRLGAGGVDVAGNETHRVL